MTPIPLTVIGGYLGAGKTALINRLLAVDHGLRLAVLVNDFGAINIDAALLQASGERIIELTNGCVCCTMSGDLFFAIGDLLDRTPRPDHIIVEASGIADPQKIAAVAAAEKDLRYAGTLTVVDGVNIVHQLADPRIEAQVKNQITGADLLVVSKVGPRDAAVTQAMRRLGMSHWVGTDDLRSVAAMVFDTALDIAVPTNTATEHPGYVQWSEANPKPLLKPDLQARLSGRPKGLLRLKALLPNPGGGYWEVHAVGPQTEITARTGTCAFGVVAIGLQDALSTSDLENWWHAE